MSATGDQELCKRYSIVIEWSDEDDAYIVTLPEFPGCHTHGATREEALKNGQEVIEILVESREEWDEPLPVPRLFQFDDQPSNAVSGPPELDKYQHQSSPSR